MNIHLDTNTLLVPPDWSRLPTGNHQITLSALVYAEFSEGLHHPDPSVVSATMRNLPGIEARYGFGVAFDGRAARIYSSICSAVRSVGRKIGRRRRMDLMIAATAAANDAAILTHNVADFSGLEGIVPIIDAGGVRS